MSLMLTRLKPSLLPQASTSPPVSLSVPIGPEMFDSVGLNRL